MMNITVWREG